MREFLPVVRRLYLLCLVVLFLVPASAFAQITPIDLGPIVNALPFSLQVKASILVCLPFVYVVLMGARRFTLPTSPTGKLVRSILTGWKHPDEITPVIGGGTFQQASKGFMKLGTLTLLAVVMTGLVFGCGALQKTTVAGSVSGKSADVSVTAPDGSTYGLLVGNHEACVTGAPFVKLPGSTIECQPACGALVLGGAVVTVECRVIGTTQTFPIHFAIPLGKS